MEEWKQCGESPRTLYFVSNLGRIKSITKKTKKERILKGFSDRDGYLKVKISRKTILIHKLVAIAFIGERPEGLDTDHINRNKDDNRAENLRYCTRSENIKNRDDFRTDISEENPILRQKITKKESQKRGLAIKINCECGGKTSKHEKARHEKSKKHQKFLKN